MSVAGSLANVAKMYPDGGYGWVIVLAGFTCNMLVDGTCYSFGLLLNDFKNEFGGTTFQTALAGSLCTGFYLMMGPVSSAIENSYGARGVTIIGSILASVGFILSTMSPNVNYFIFCWGVLGGCGFGLVYLPSIIVASHWFQAKRGTAMGFIVSGSGMGAALLSKVVYYLFAMYDWRGVVWILVGLMLNMIAMGALFRPVTPDDYQKSDEDDLKIVENDEMPQIRNTEVVCDCGDHGSTVVNRVAASNAFMSHSRLNMPTGAGAATAPHVSSNHNIGSASNLWETREDYYDINAPRNRYEATQNRYDRQRRSTFAIDTFRASNVDLKRVLSSRSIMPYSRSNLYADQTAYENYYSMVDVNQYGTVGGSGEKPSLKEAVIGPLKEMLNFSLLKRVSFSLLVFATVCTMMALFVPFVYISSYAINEANLTIKESSTLIVVLGLSNTVGRLLAGYLSDFPWMDPLVMNNFALIVAGVATMAVPFLKSFYSLVAYVIIFGNGIATFVCLRTIILDSIFGIEYLNNSFGIMLLFHGVASVVGSPIAGMLYDYTGSYFYTFFLSGIFLAFSGAVCIPLRPLAAWEQRIRNRRAGAAGAESRRETVHVNDEQQIYNSSLYPEAVTEYETVL